MNRKTYHGKRVRTGEDQRAILYLNIVSGVVVLLAGMWIGTQVAAAALDHQPRLGPPWFVVLDYRVYYPWRFLQWDYYYGSYAPRLFWQSYAWLYGSIFLEGLIVLYLAVLRATAQKAGDAYGTARWATLADLKRNGLLNGRGIVLGLTIDGKQRLQHDGPEHAFVAAGPRTGKGVGIVIPTLLSWEGSTVVLDIKGENWVRTAAFRSTFSHCLKFNPVSRDSIHYNPLFEIRPGDNEFRDTQAIVDMVMDNGEDYQREDHWIRTGKSLLIAMILHVMYAEPDKSLPGVTTFISNPARTELDTLQTMLTTRHLGDRPHPIVASMVREVLDKAENELSGVFSTARSFLTIFHDPVIAANIRDSEFSISDLMNRENPVSLYLTNPASDIERVKPLYRIFLNQMGRRLTETLSEHHDQPHYRHKLLLMLDEFALLGYMAFFETSLAFLPGYGIQAFIICQSLNQIEKWYGPNNSILDTCRLRITFGATDERTAKRLSELLGQSTQVRKMANYAGHRLAPFLGHVMVSEQESPRPLLTPGEILNLPATDSLLMVGGLPPYYGRRLRFYDDPVFRTRAHHQDHSAPPPQSREELQRELPPPPQCAWQLRVNGASESSEQSTKSNGAQWVNRPASQDNTDTSSTYAPTDARHSHKLPDPQLALDFDEELSLDVARNQPQEEDRTLAVTKERHRLSQLRGQQQLQQTVELARHVTKDLPL